MLILGIDTAAAPCCAAVYDTEKGQILGSTVINNKLTHSVTLMPVVRDLVRNAELSMEDIGLFAVANNVTAYDCVVCAAMDARCNQVYVALFRVNGGKVERLTEEECLKTDEAARMLSEYDDDIMLVGDGAFIMKKATDDEGLENVKIAPDPLRYQTGYGVCLAAVNAPQLTPEQLMPMYLKLPQAQRELMAKNAEAYKERKE